MQDLHFRTLPAIAVVDGATTPVPGSTGAWAWSTTLGVPMHWNGSRWTALGVMQAETDEAILGSELTSNGAFTGDATGWTLGSGWAYNANSVVLTLGGGAEGTLSQAITVTTGKAYLIAWTQTNSAAGNGTIKPKLGTAQGVALCPPETANMNMAQVLTAAEGGAVTLEFEPTDITSSGTITVDSVSVLEITPIGAVRKLLNVDGGTEGEERVAYKYGFGLNTLNGLDAGRYITQGYAVVGIGNKAARNVTSGYSLMALGHNALSENTIGHSSVGIGQAALKQQIAGYQNAGAGTSALRENLTGYNLVGVGFAAGRYTASGALNTRSYNSVYVGADARPSANGNSSEIVIGAGAQGNGTNTATLGNSSTTVYGSKHNTTQIDLVGVSVPNAPSTEMARLWGMDLAGHLVPAMRGPRGLPKAMQRMVGRGQVAWAVPKGPSSTIPHEFGITLTVTGTWSALTVDGANRAKWVRRVQTVAGPTTTAVVGWREVYTSYSRGNAVGVGGFFHVLRFGPGSGGTNTTKRLFAGFAASTAAPTDVDPASQTNCLGVGYDQATDSNMQFLHNDSAGTCTKVNLGANFQIATADHDKWYELIMYAEPNGSAIFYRMEDLDSGAVASGSVSSDIPSNTTFLAHRAWASVGGTSALAGLVLGSLYTETDY